MKFEESGVHGGGEGSGEDTGVGAGDADVLVIFAVGAWGAFDLDGDAAGAAECEAAVVADGFEAGDFVGAVVTAGGFDEWIEGFGVGAGGDEAFGQEGGEIGFGEDGFDGGTFTGLHSFFELGVHGHIFGEDIEIDTGVVTERADDAIAPDECAGLGIVAGDMAEDDGIIGEDDVALDVGEGVREFMKSGGTILDVNDALRGDGAGEVVDLWAACEGGGDGDLAGGVTEIVEACFDGVVDEAAEGGVFAEGVAFA